MEMIFKHLSLKRACMLLLMAVVVKASPTPSSDITMIEDDIFDDYKVTLEATDFYIPAYRQELAWTNAVSSNALSTLEKHRNKIMLEVSVRLFSALYHF